MASPAEARRRWNLVEARTAVDPDLGDALAIVPARGGALRGLLLEAVEASGGYVALAAEVAADDPDLA